MRKMPNDGGGYNFWFLVAFVNILLKPFNEGLFPFVSHFGVQSDTAEEGGDIGRSIPQ